MGKVTGNLKKLDTDDEVNIFKFMTDFRIRDTRVVVVGQDPPPSQPLSGYAYHRNNSPSTERIPHYCKEEMDLINEMCVPDFHEDPPVFNQNRDENVAEEECDLSWWVQQSKTQVT